MPRKALLARIPWEDRFSVPTLRELLGRIEKQHATTFCQARAGLLAITPASEAIIWHGLPWRWTVVYHSPGADRPWAYLIPQPARPRLALPLDVAFVRAMQCTRISRYAREGLLAGPQVGTVLWAQWDLLTAAMTDELLSIARQRFEQTLAQVG
jgi:hypothetical protein